MPFPCQLPNSLWLRLWCQGQQHLPFLELLRNAESEAHPDLLTQTPIWTWPLPFSLMGSFWWVITCDSQDMSLTVWNWTQEFPSLCCDWERGSRMFCTPRFTYFYALKVVPWHYNLILCDSASFLCTFPVESVFITGSFHPAVYPSPHQPPAGTRGIFHGLSPAWTWSQRQPCAAVYVRLFHHLMG